QEVKWALFPAGGSSVRLPVSVARFSGTVREVERGFQCFRHLANRGVLERIFNALSDDPDCENVFVDGTTAPRQTRTGH
ncbi:MAG: hypothetical protein OXC72_03075, partial [Roseovarius sp.]|nr:hypothetical protein [Roseovarius sp.]